MGSLTKSHLKLRIASLHSPVRCTVDIPPSRTFDSPTSPFSVVLYNQIEIELEFQKGTDINNVHGIVYSNVKRIGIGWKYYRINAGLRYVGTYLRKQFIQQSVSIGEAQISLNKRKQLQHIGHVSRNILMHNKFK